MNTSVVRKIAGLTLCAFSVLGCAGQRVRPSTEDFTRPVIIHQMQDADLKTLLVKVKRVRRDFVARLGLSEHPFEHVEGASVGFPVLRYRFGDRCLFLEIDQNKDTVLDAYFSDVEPLGTTSRAVVDPKDNLRSSTPVKPKN